MKTVGVSEDYAKKSFFDTLHKKASSLQKRDFTYVEKGISVGDEILVGGTLEFKNKYILSNPTLVIGSDKEELKQFVGRRREHFHLVARNFGKLCIGITLVHAVLFQVPALFETHFEEKPQS